MKSRCCRATPWLGNRFALLVVAFIAGLSLLSSAHAEPIKVGVVKVSGAGTIFWAKEQGYFAVEGLEAELVFFEASQPIAVASVAGDITFGQAGLTAGLYNLAAQGALRIIAGSSREVPGFRNIGYLVSNAAAAKGLKALGDLPGHSVAITQAGSPVHYSLGLLAEKYHFDLAALRLVALQSIPNQISAIIGGQSDAAPIPATAALPVIARGEAKLLGWVGDETPWQFGAVIASTKTTNERRDTVERFLRAYRKGARDVHDAFTGADETRKDGPAAAAVEAVIAHYTGEPVERIRLGITYADPEGRLDVADVRHQIAWYLAQAMLKGPLASEAVIDRRYVIPLAR
jgi:NitT/TauT family transport system substrate-binding protein